MEFIAIRNKGTLDRQLLELVGLSTKKGKDVGRIGFKGSGTKLAAIAAIRSGLETSMSSTDAHGPYYLQFTSSPLVIVDGDVTIETARVEYHYWKTVEHVPVHDYVHETQFVVDAFADRNTPIGTDGNPAFRIVHEHICNAYDADRAFVVEVVETPDGLRFAEPGHTVVYIRCSEQVRALFEEVDRYFKFLSTDTPIAVVDGVGEIWPKSDPAATRLFIRGVLAACYGDLSRRTLYDYSLFERALLSEDRVLKDEYEYKTCLGRLLLRLRDDSVVDYLLERIAEGQAPFELEALDQVHASDPAFKEGSAFWLAAARRVFGEKIVIPSQNEYSNQEAEQLYGYRLVGRASQHLRSFLRDLGVPDADVVVPRKFDDRIEQVPFDGLPTKSRDRFFRVFTLFAKYFPEYAAYRIAFFRAKRKDDGVVESFVGFASNECTEIWIKVDAKGRFTSDEDLLETLVHEARHCVSKANDHDRRFVNVADRDIAMLIFRQEGLAFTGEERGIQPWGDGTILPSLVPMPPLEHDTLELDLDGVIFLPEDDDRR